MPVKRSKAKTKTENSLTAAVVKGLEDKKGRKIVKMDLRKSGGAVADYYIVCTGTSDTHVQAICDSVYETVRKECNEKPVGIEGERQGEWVLMDYVNVVVHIFLKEKRAFYNIEDLWGDAEFEYIGPQD